MNCQRNVNSILPTQLPHKFSYIDAILIHNDFDLLRYNFDWKFKKNLKVH
jgi:hypothetical protein